MDGRAGIDPTRRNFASRQGLDFLTTIGITETVATNLRITAIRPSRWHTIFRVSPICENGCVRQWRIPALAMEASRDGLAEPLAGKYGATGAARQLFEVLSGLDSA